MVISSITLALWLPSFILPLLKSEGKVWGSIYAIPNFDFSHLWLTAFVFAAQDWNKSSCSLNAPVGGSCNLKLTSEAFIFLALFFSLVSFAAYVWAWKVRAVKALKPVVEEKVRTAEPAAPASV